MSDRAKRPGRETVFDVFRPHGDHDVSAENYLLKKQTRQQRLRGPVNTHQITDQRPTPTDGATEPRNVVLSVDDSTADNHQACAVDANAPDDAPAPNAIRVETFRIDMAERLAAMQAAQQKAKEQLSALESQHAPTETPPAD